MNQSLLAIGYLLKGINSIYDYHTCSTQDVQQYRQSVLANIASNIKEIRDNWMHMADNSVACYFTYQKMMQEIIHFGNVLKEIALGTVPIFPTDIPNTQKLAESADRCQSLLLESDSHLSVFKQISPSPLSRSIRSVEGAFFWISHFGADETKAIVSYEEFYTKLYNTAPEVVGPVAELIHAAFVPIPSKTGQDKVSCFAWSTFLSFYYRSPHDVLQSTCSLFPGQHPSLPGFVHNLGGILMHPLSPYGIPALEANPLPSSPSQLNHRKTDKNESAGANFEMGEYCGRNSGKLEDHSQNQNENAEGESSSPPKSHAYPNLGARENGPPYYVPPPVPSGQSSAFSIMVATSISDFVNTFNHQWLHLHMLANRDAGNALMNYGRGSGTFLFHPVSNVQHAIALSFVQQDNTLVHALIHVTKKAIQDPITLPAWANKVPLAAKRTSSPQLPRKELPPPIPMEGDNENEVFSPSLMADVIRAGEMAVNASGKDAKPSWKPFYYVLFNYGSLSWFKNRKEFASKKPSKGFIKVGETLKYVSPKNISNTEFAFELETIDNNRYCFKVGTYKEHNAWLEALYPYQLGSTKSAQ